LDGSIDELRHTNVGGTKRILALAREVHVDHGLSRLGHVSTAYVAGSRKGTIPEESLSGEAGFSSRYEVSKFEGEELVRDAKADLPISVFRPGMVVGHSRTGYIKTFNTVYFPLKLYLTGRLRVFPLRSSLKVNLVPVDYVAEVIVRLTLDERAEGLNFHLTAPYEALPTAKELLTYVRRWARERRGVHIKAATFIPSPAFATRGRYHAQQVITREREGIFKTLRTYAPYFSERRRFARDNVDRLHGEYQMDWRTVLDNILGYAFYMGFFHRSGRTVHEQILFRMRGRSLPVTLNDIYGGEVHRRDPAQVRKEMLAVAEGLRRMGVEPGDRVALVGLNCSRFVTIDVGIGLSGAASVPLYYTSPPQEIDQILEASGAKVLFVGTPKLLERLDEMGSTIPVVSFCREDPAMDHGREVIRWTDYLATGMGSEGPTTSPVGLGDLATVRYTSGTTGTPKGVTFVQENLRWIGENTASFIEWEVRSKRFIYLSFLPMNHVIEGIMALYGPYYIPAPLDIYYLEDFRDLQETLPRVRPTIFVSVPRFYEKIWEAVVQNSTGRKYHEATEGFKKGILRRLVRRVVLKKAGLDRCSQLLVGSAPMSKDVQTNLHDLGIEVHDAYGLTEAPLVTMNRLGENRLGTVGKPLADTDIHIAEDGEVMIKGPQVTPGYLDPGLESPQRDGWFMTGDLGQLTDEGSLVIHGRKKEVIVTSYGKNVYPVKVEGLLRDLSGVDEVMVVGDNRPYCTALLWLSCEDAADPLVSTVTEQIAKVNEGLAKAEQVKRWALLPNDLTIDGGDLTASLKLKRGPVGMRFAGVVDALYGDVEPPAEGVLRLGGADRNG
jgi:long-chain acyl-CoA synthetase